MYSILICCYSIAGHFYLFSAGETTVVGLSQALIALFGLGVVVIMSFLIFTSLRKWNGKGRTKLMIIIQVLSIYSALICSYSIVGNLYLFFTKKPQSMELYGVIGAVFAFAPVIVMAILVLAYLRKNNAHIA